MLTDQLEVTVKLALTPALQPGHKIELLFDGEAVDQSTGNANFILRDLERGSHSIQARVLDNSGRAIGSSNTVNIHVKRNITRGPLAAPKAF